MIRVGEWNWNVVVLGRAGNGKSTFICQVASRLIGGSYVFAHDRSWRLPKKGPGGETYPHVRYETIGQVKQHIDTKGGGSILSATRASFQETLDCARATSNASLWAGGKCKHPAGTPHLQDECKGLPSLLLIDDAAQCNEANPNHIDKELRNAITGRRHEHVGWVWSIQDPRWIHYATLSEATMIACFNLTDDDALTKLRKVGFPPAALREIPKLPKFRYVLHKL